MICQVCGRVYKGDGEFPARNVNDAHIHLHRLRTELAEARRAAEEIATASKTFNPPAGPGIDADHRSAVEEIELVLVDPRTVSP